MTIVTAPTVVALAPRLAATANAAVATIPAISKAFDRLQCPLGSTKLTGLFQQYVYRFRDKRKPGTA